MKQASPLWLVLALWGAGLGAAAQFGKVAVIFDLMARQYPAAGPTALGWLVSIVGFVGLVFGTTAGLLVQRIGVRRALVGALLAGAALSAVQTLFPPLPVMLALRAMEGLSHLAIVVTAPVLIAQVTPVARQGAAMTLWSSFFGLTFAILGSAGRALALTQGAPALFLAHAVYMAVFALLLMRMLPRDRRAEAAPLSLPRIIGEHGQIYSSPRVAAPAMGFVMYTLTYVALLTLLPPLVGGAHQVLLATAMPLVSIAVSLTLGVWLLGRVRAVRLVQAGFAVAAVAAATLWAVWGQGGPVMVACLVIAAALGLVQGASFAAIPQLNATAEDRARAAGAVAQLGNVGTTTGTPILSVVILSAGVGGLSAFVVLCSLAGIAVHLVQARRRQAFST